MRRQSMIANTMKNLVTYCSRQHSFQDLPQMNASKSATECIDVPRGGNGFVLVRADKAEFIKYNDIHKTSASILFTKAT